MKVSKKGWIALAAVVVVAGSLAIAKSLAPQPAASPSPFAPTNSATQSPNPTSDSSAAPSPTGTAKPSASSTPTAPYFPFALAVGDCFNPLEDVHTKKVVAIDCAKPHKAQLIGSDVAWRGEKRWDVDLFKGHAKETCGEIDNLVDASWDWVNDDNLQLGLVLPSKASYRKNENVVACYLYSSKSVEGSFFEPKPVS